MKTCRRQIWDWRNIRQDQRGLNSPTRKRTTQILEDNKKIKQVPHGPNEKSYCKNYLYNPLVLRIWVIPNGVYLNWWRPKTIPAICISRVNNIESQGPKKSTDWWAKPVKISKCVASLDIIVVICPTLCSLRARPDNLKDFRKIFPITFDPVRRCFNSKASSSSSPQCERINQSSSPLDRIVNALEEIRT